MDAKGVFDGTEHKVRPGGMLMSDGTVRRAPEDTLVLVALARIVGVLKHAVDDPADAERGLDDGRREFPAHKESRTFIFF